MLAQQAPVVVVLGQKSIPVAQKIIRAFPGARLYGLAGRTQDVDVVFTEFGNTLRELFTTGIPIIGICSTGILIRTLAPLLTNKRQEPPVLAIAEDGSAIVPLLGGLNGVNHLARKIGEVLHVSPAITTTGDIRFGMALEDPPPGYYLSRPEFAKTFMSDLLAGDTLRLEGNAPWLQNSSLPWDREGKKTIKITEKSDVSTQNCLVYHPATVAIAITTNSKNSPLPLVENILRELDIAPESVAGIFAHTLDAVQPVISSLAAALGVPLRLLTTAEIGGDESADMAVRLALGATSGEVICHRRDHDFSVAVAIAPLPLDIPTIGKPPGRLAIIGTGPGTADWMSPEVKGILQQATDFVGYSTYLKMVSNFTTGKNIHESDNRQEISRATLALDLAAPGRFVAVVSSGDPGIYAMAAAVFEAWEQGQKTEWQNIEIQVAPGISAMQAAAARIGAPLGHDFCTISLSDILKPWSIIAQRIQAAAEADFVIAFYNPISGHRTWQLTEAKNLLLHHRSPETPLILARNVGRKGESVKVDTLGEFSPETADMRTVIIVGSSQTRVISRPDGGVWVYTPRSYGGEISPSSL
ncbi:precorrin-3B C(17)-methyltransferase [Calothrix sp. 336/3]|uniref:precorrin-3B C(17)-methyltransferase n=1 Tax=Calothrix sp. 336/3 TaxID=1337936 RepID=UPI0004E3B5C9|nr:precorrin-3B C(17)-methyltransferase [Calothrix sp. 336/3]AKG19987.1 precorrin-3B C17-methyltransferase [Calothrix sp. 336/3]